LVQGAFFQNMIHSGLNAYLTLALAQALLRAGDVESLALVHAVADLASPTGQWPEAVHPRTGGGCMGDGQHLWASAEWALMMRSLFVREEGDRLILLSGLPEDWLTGEFPIAFGPTCTAHGPVTVAVERRNGALHARWQADWYARQPTIEVRATGMAPVTVTDPSITDVRLEPA
jgi:hypothetical protein